MVDADVGGRHVIPVRKGSSMYFVIYTSEDGTYIEQISGDELKKRLEEEYWGSAPAMLDEVPKDADPNCWPRGLLIIRGEVFVPKPVQRVTEWEVP